MSNGEDRIPLSLFDTRHPSGMLPLREMHELCACSCLRDMEIVQNNLDRLHEADSRARHATLASGSRIVL